MSTEKSMQIFVIDAFGKIPKFVTATYKTKKYTELKKIVN